MEQCVKRPNLAWYYFDTNSPAALSFLQKSFSFHQLDYEDVEGGPQQPKIDFYPDYLFGIFHFPAEESKGESIHVFELDVFMGENFLVTISKGGSNILKSAYQQARKDKKYQEEIMGKDGAFLLYKILDLLTESCWPEIRKISSQINDIEEEIYSERLEKTTLHKIALTKRNLIRLKRIIYPEQLAISSLVRSDKYYLPATLNIYFDDVNDTLKRLQMINESHIDVMKDLHNVNESLISQRTTLVVKLLTVISVSLLPLTLLSGIYGMNIDRLPFAHEPRNVWFIYLGLLAVILTVIGFLRRRGWL